MLVHYALEVGDKKQNVVKSRLRWGNKELRLPKTPGRLTHDTYGALTVDKSSCGFVYWPSARCTPNTLPQGASLKELLRQWATFLLAPPLGTDMILPESEGTWQRAAQIIAAGGLVVFPTDTVYGCGLRPEKRGRD